MACFPIWHNTADGTPATIYLTVDVFPLGAVAQEKAPGRRKCTGCGSPWSVEVQRRGQYQYQLRQTPRYAA